MNFVVIVRFLILYSLINLSILFAYRLKDGFSSVEKSVEVILSSVFHELPMLFIFCRLGISPEGYFYLLITDSVEELSFVDARSMYADKGC